MSINKNKNGNMDSLKRKYDSLKGWVGKNPVEKMGTIICASSNNDDVYDIQFQADGKSTFLELYKKWKEGGSSEGGGGSVSPEELEDAVNKAMDEAFNKELSPEEQAEQEAADTAAWEQAMREAEDAYRKSQEDQHDGPDEQSEG